MSQKVNIKNLTEAEAIKAGDYLIIETSTGTKILNFKNFSVDTSHTTFADTLSAQTTDISGNYSLIQQLSGSVTANKTLVSEVSGLTGLNWRESWSSANTYKKQDAVEYDNSSFVSKIDSNNNNIPVDGNGTLNSNWMYLSKKGSVTVPLSSASAILSYDGSSLVEVKPAGDSEIGYILTSQGVSNTPTWSQASATRPGQVVDKVWTSYIGQKWWVGNQSGVIIQMTDGKLLKGGDDDGYGHLAHGPVHANTYSKFGEMMFDTRTWVASAQKIKGVYPMGISNFVITSAGDCYSCGYNEYGELGHADTTNRNILTRIEYFKTNNIAIDRVLMQGNSNDSDQGTQTTMFLTTAGDLYSCGYNAHGQCGIGNTTSPQSTPVRVSNIGVGESPGKVVDFWHGGNYGRTYAKCADGKVYVWGYNGNGALGLGNTTSQSSPTEVAALSGAAKLEVSSNGIYYNNAGSAAYEQTIALISDGTVKSCGWDANNYGIHGNGSTTELTSFDTVSGIGPGTPDGPVTDIAHSGSYWESCAALTSGGELYTWGYDGAYNLCGFNIGNQTTPLKVSNVAQALSSASIDRGIWDIEGDIQEIGNHSGQDHGSYGNQVLTVRDSSGHFYSAGFNKTNAGIGSYNHNIPAPHLTTTYTTAGFEKWFLPCQPNEVKQWGFFNAAPWNANEYYTSHYFIVTTTGRLFLWGGGYGTLPYYDRIGANDWTYESIWNEVRF